MTGGESGRGWKSAYRFEGSPEHTWTCPRLSYSPASSLIVYPETRWQIAGVRDLELEERAGELFGNNAQHPDAWDRAVGPMEVGIGAPCIPAEQVDTSIARNRCRTVDQQPANTGPPMNARHFAM